MKIDVEEIVKSDYTLEDVIVLMEIEYARRGKFFPYSSTKKEQYTSLYQRGVLTATPDGYSISVTGYQELRKIIGEKPLQLKKAAVVSNFEEFWNAYPISDAHGKWLRTRTLKSDKVKCIKYYNEALKRGVSHLTIMEALKWDVKDRRYNSNLKNRMSFMKASSAWLFQREYEVIKETMGDDSENEADNNWTENTI